MPIDFIDQLSKFEKGTLLDIRRPFVIGAFSESTNKDLQAKDVVVTLNGQAAKHRSGKS
jgi:regulator of sigma E protease